MKPVRLTAKNFLTFKELDFSFKDGATLLVGQNLTDDNQVSNGSGKSAIQAALEFCLLAYTSRKVTDRALIHFGEDSSDLSLTINCPVRKQDLIIDRVINAKGSGKCKLWINNREKGSEIELATVNDCNKFIIEWLDISKEDLSNYYIINKERFRSFFSSSNTQKIELIGRFSRANTLDGIDDLVKADIKKIEAEVREVEMKSSMIQGGINKTKQDIEDEKSIDFEEKKKERIDAIKSKIGNEKEFISDYKQTNKEKGVEKNRLKNELNELNNELEKISNSIDLNEDNPFTALFDTISKQKNKIQSDKKNFNNELEKKKKVEKEINLLLQDIRLNLSGTVHCPSCGFEFKVGEEVNVEEERERLPEAETLLEMAKKSVESVESKMDILDTKLTGLKDKEWEVEKEQNKFNEEKRKIRETINNVKSKIEDSKNEIESCDKTIESNLTFIEMCEKNIKAYDGQIISIGEEKKDDSRMKSLEKSIKEDGKKIEELSEQEKELQLKIFQKSQWIEQFKEFKFYLANESIKVIQGYCNKSLGEMGSDLQVLIEGYKALASGKMKEEITPYIVREEIRDFWSFSGGERARMEYAMIMAIQAMINATNKYGGFHFLSTDEAPSEGLDEEGIKYVIKSLADYEFPIMITTHVNNVKIDTQTVTVRKENGISNLIYE